MAVLLAGDWDYVPAVESLGSRGIGTRVVFWRHATARDLQAVATDLVPPGELIHIDVKKLGRIEGGAGKRITAVGTYT